MYSSVYTNAVNDSIKSGIPKLKIYPQEKINTANCEDFTKYKVTTVVFAHGAEIDTVKRHIKIWAKFSDNILIVSPSNDRCFVDGATCITYQEVKIADPLSIERQLFGLKVALLYESDYYVFQKYNSIMLSRPYSRQMVQGNLFNENIFISKNTNSTDCFLHFPWVFPSDILKRFIREVKIQEEDKDYNDVWMAKKLMSLDIPVFNLMQQTKLNNTLYLTSEGFSRNSLEKEEILNEACKLASTSTYAFHGIKTQKTLTKILESTNKTELLKKDKIYTYYSDIGFDGQEDMISLWKTSWEKNGFEAIVLTEDDAKKSPYYSEFLEELQKINLNICGRDITEYGLACYLRWLAYSTQDNDNKFLVSDYDVINNGYLLTQFNKYPKLTFFSNVCPCFALGSPSQFFDFCKKIIELSKIEESRIIREYTEGKCVHYNDQEFLSINKEKILKLCDFPQVSIIAQYKQKSINTASVVHVSHSSIQSDTKNKHTETRLKHIKNLLGHI